jgi:signal transduction histidine kinase
MNYQQQNIPNDLKSNENGTYYDSENSKSLISPVVASKTSEYYFKLRLQELESHNANLEVIIGQKTRELSEIAATNSKFISIIAHDLWSPFSTILGALELLKGKLDHYQIEDIDRYINIASNSAKRTIGFIESLIEWAISQNKERNFNPVKINLRQLLDDEIDNMHILATLKKIRLCHFIEPGLNISADLQMARTIFRNLISNAIKYTNNSGEILITASEKEQFVEIAIQDDGIGISLKAQNELFKLDKFHSTTGTNNEPGTGLGLLLCKEFVELHGGNILIESEPGKGSIFKITLPHYI